MEIARLKEELIQQRKSKFKGNIYHYSQVNFAYNSNKIEGGRLSEDETEEIFETDSFIPKSDETIKLDDLIEMKNHFRLFDYALDTLNDDLSKEMIINMNKILKRNTTDEENPRYNVGGFKIIPNKIGLINVIDTSAPPQSRFDSDTCYRRYQSGSGSISEGCCSANAATGKAQRISKAAKMPERILFINKPPRKSYFLR